jgi:hypothetical protein
MQAANLIVIKHAEACPVKGISFNKLTTEGLPYPIPTG